MCVLTSVYVLVYIYIHIYAGKWFYQKYGITLIEPYRLGYSPGRLYGILELAVGTASVTLAGDTNRHRYWLLCHLRVLDRGVIEFRL